MNLTKTISRTKKVIARWWNELLVWLRLRSPHIGQRINFNGAVGTITEYNPKTQICKWSDQDESQMNEPPKTKVLIRQCESCHWKTYDPIRIPGILMDMWICARCGYYQYFKNFLNRKIEYYPELDPLKRFAEIFPDNFQIQITKIKDIVDRKGIRIP